MVTRGRKSDKTCGRNAGLLTTYLFDKGNLLTQPKFKVWDGVSDARVTFSASELLSPEPISELSRLTENLNIQRALLHRISLLPSIEVMDKVKVQSIVQDSQDGSDWPLVHLSDGRVIRTRLLVGVIFSFTNATGIELDYVRLALMVLTHPSAHMQEYNHMDGPTTLMLSLERLFTRLEDPTHLLIP